MNRVPLKLIILFAIFVIPWIVPAQVTTKPEARKFDEFGDIQVSDLKARLDNFAIRLQQEPTTKGFMIVYVSRRDLPGLSMRLAGRAKDYLVNSRGIQADRLVMVDGGVTDCLTQEFWIVPPGATPKPRNSGRGLFRDTDSAWKFDEYYYPLPETYDEGDEYAGNSLEAYADALQKNPRSRAYILTYQQYGAGQKPDTPNTAMRMFKAVQKDLVNKYKIAASRIRFMNGGHRKQRQIELWLVPRGQHPPIATPNSFPKRRR